MSKTTIETGTAIKGKQVYHADNTRVFNKIFKLLSRTKSGRCRIEIISETTNGNDPSKTITVKTKKTVSFQRMLKMQWEFLGYCTTSEIVKL